MSARVEGAKADTCPLCRNASAQLLRAGLRDRLGAVRGEWSIVICVGCGLARTAPRPGPDGLAGLYDERYLSAALGVGAELPPPPSRARRALELLCDGAYWLRWGGTAVPVPPRPGAAVLDVGPGGGHELQAHVACGWEGWLVDPSPEVVAVAARRAAISAERAQLAPLERAELPSAHFDRILMSHVVEHLADPLEALRLVRAALRDDGRLVLRCPNFASLERRAFGRFWSGLDIPRHLQHFSAATLGRALAEAGFTVLRVRPQLDYASVTLSLSLALRAGFGKRPRLSYGSALYVPVLPLIAAARVAGAAGVIEVDARAC